MPTINRIRFVNIHYSQDKFCYADAPFECWSENALLILFNGGGKSLALNLITTAAMGIDMREGRDFFGGMLLGKKNRTSTAMVEWKLDDGRTFLVSGVCFTQGERDPKWFYFTSEYQQENEFDIAQMPLKHDGLILGQETFRGNLVQAGRTPGQKIRVFGMDQRADYSRHLSGYRIFRTEWEEILRTNGKEGGLADYLEGYPTSSHVLERLILPRIAKALEGDDTSDLAATLHRYIEQIQQIPELERQQTEFQTLAEEVVRTLDALEAYRGADQSFRESLGTLHGATQALAAAHTDLTNQQQGRLEQHESLRRERREHRWHERSLEFTLSSQEGERLQAIHAQAAAVLAAAEVRLRDARHQEDWAQAANHWVERVKSLAQAHQVQTEIDLMGEDEPALQTRLSEAAGLFKAHLVHRLALLEAERQGLGERQAAYTAEHRRIQAEQADHQAALDGLLEQAGVLKSDLGHIERERHELADHFTALELSTPAETAVALQQVKGDLEQQREEGKGRSTLLDGELQTLNEERVQRQSRLAQLQGEANILQGAIQRFRQREGEVLERLQRVGITATADRLFDGSLLPELVARLQQRQADLDLLSVEQDGEERRRAWLGGEDAFLNRDLKSVSQALALHGIAPQTGLEYLRSQVDDEPTRRQIVQENPLLPYSLVVDEAEHHYIERHPQTMAHLFLTAPVPILRRDRALLTVAGGEAAWVLLPTHKGAAAFVSTEIAEILQEVMDSLARIKSARTKLLQETEALHGAQGALARFSSEFTRSQIECDTAKLEANGAEQEVTTGRLEVLLQAVDQTQRERDALSSRLEALEDEHRRVWQRLDKLERWLPQAQREGPVRQESTKVAAEITSRRQIVTEQTRQANEVRQRLNELGELVGEKSREVARLNEELTPLGDVTPAAELSGDLPTSRAEWAATKQAVSERLSGLELKVRLLHAHQSQAARSQRAAEELGFTAEQLHDVTTAVSDERLGRYKEYRAECEQGVAAQRGVVGDAKSAVDQHAGGLRQLGQAISEECGKDPLCFIDPDRTRSELAARAVSINKREAEIEGELGRLQGRLARLKVSLDRLRALVQQYPANEVTPVRWEEIEANLDRYTNELGQHLKERGEAKRRTWQALEQVRQEFEDRLGRQMDLRQLRRLLSEEEALLAETREHLLMLQQVALQNMESIQNSLRVHREVLDEIVAECGLRLRNLRDAIRDMQRFSRVQFPGESGWRQLLQIDLPAPDQDEAEALKRHLLQVVAGLHETTKERWPDEARRAVSSGALLGAVIDLGRVSIKIVKVLETGPAEMEAWEKIARPSLRGGWSGGETYLAALTVYLCLQAYFRNRLCGSERSPKVLLSDNPFGKMSSRHLLVPVKMLLEATNTQWICATALKEADILDLFSIHHSIKAVQVGDISLNTPQRQMHAAKFAYLQEIHPLHGPRIGFA